MKLFTFWRSLAAFRVRIVLNLKGIAAEQVQVDLLAGHQLKPEFKAINPQGVIPALVLDDGRVLFQSMAIMEYLDEIQLAPPLMPMTTAGRARVRGLAQIAVADGHPFATPRVRTYLEKNLSLDDAKRTEWCRHFMGEALAAIEGHLARDKETGRYCHGDQVTLADVCLASQVVGYGYFGGKPDAYPTVARIHAAYMQLDAFAKAHPLAQPGAPKA